MKDKKPETEEDKRDKSPSFKKGKRKFDEDGNEIFLIDTSTKKTKVSKKKKTSSKKKKAEEKDVDVDNY